MSNSLLPVYRRSDIEFVSGEGCYLFDKDNNKYLDLAAGIAVNSMGYANPKLVKALQDAAHMPWHLSNLYQITGQNQLADKLVQNSSCDQVFFCNSGTEAIEAAIKIIRRYFANDPKKNKILTFEHGFHGRTMAAISASGTKQYKDGFEPLLPGFENIPWKDVENNDIDKYLTEDVSAIILEPIQGEGGINIFPTSLLENIEKRCRKNNIILAVDEVQSGMARTGKLFAYQYSKISPDIITVAKGIGGGFPLGGVLVKSKIGSCMTAGSHGGTYGGNPLAMKVGNVIIDYMLTKGTMADIAEKGNLFIAKLKELQVKYPHIIKDVRGKGLMIGVEVIDGAKMVDLLRKNKLLTVSALHNIVRILPPLIITKEQILTACQILDKALLEYKL